MAQKNRAIQAACPPELAFQLAQRALAESGFKVKGATLQNGTIIAERGMGLLTMGNRIIVTMEPGGPMAPNDVFLTIHSESKGKQLIDYGENGRMVSKFEAAFTRLVQEESSTGVIDRNKWQPRV